VVRKLGSLEFSAVSECDRALVVTPKRDIFDADRRTTRNKANRQSSSSINMDKQFES